MKHACMLDTVVLLSSGPTCLEHQVLAWLQEQRSKAREDGVERKRQARTAEQRQAAKGFYKGLVADSDYQGEDYEVFSSWLGETQAV